MTMDALLKPASPLNQPAGAGSAAIGANTVARNAPASTRMQAAVGDNSDGVARATPTARVLRSTSQPNQHLQGEVARAQQALDYLNGVAGQLEALKSDLSARLSGRAAASRGLEARAMQLADTLDARRTEGGASLDAQLDFDADRGAQKRFRIRGLDIATLKAGGDQSLGFSVGNAGGPQLATRIEPGMTEEEIARRLDRTLAAVKVRVGLDQNRELVFSTPEALFDDVKDAMAVTGRGRVETVALPASLAPQEWESGSPDALRQSLREVVQALARVRRSQDAASLALSTAMAHTAQPDIPSAELAAIAGDFSATAASHDYASLLAITSALVGVSRDRVQALLGLR